MIRSFVVTNHENQSLTLELAKPYDTGIAVMHVDGLGSPPIDVNVTDLSNIDGSVFNFSKSQMRNIVFDLKLLAVPTIEQVRLKIYRYFAIKKELQIDIRTDSRYVGIKGYVETLTPDIFSKDERVQVSIVCPNPFFYDMWDSSTLFSGTLPLFEFPIQNEGVENPGQNRDPAVPHIELSKISLDRTVTFDYTGDVDTGILVQVHLLSEVTNDINIYNLVTREQFIISSDVIRSISGNYLGMGDDVYISTVAGGRYVRLVRNGITTNVIGAVSIESSWIQLTPGSNSFGFDANGEENGILVTFSYRNAFLGV